MKYFAQVNVQSSVINLSVDGNNLPRQFSQSAAELREPPATQNHHQRQMPDLLRRTSVTDTYKFTEVKPSTQPLLLYQCKLSEPSFLSAHACLLYVLYVHACLSCLFIAVYSTDNALIHILIDFRSSYHRLYYSSHMFDD